MAFNPRTINKELDFANLAKHNDNYADIKTELDAHDAHIAAQTAHGSTADATPGKIMQRDSAGRAKVAAPAAADDIARKAEVDAVQEALDEHIGDAGVHLSGADRDKLDGIEPGAEPNQNAFAQVNNVVAASESDTLTIAGGTGITISTNPTTKTVTVTATGTATPGAHGSSHDNDGSDPIPDLVALRGEFDALTAADIGAETPDGAQARVDALAGVGNTKTVAEVAGDVADVTAQMADTTNNFNSHKANTLMDGVHGLSTTANITLYCDFANGNDSYNGLAPASPLKSIGAALAKIPLIINHDVIINVVGPSNYYEVVNINGFLGKGSLSLVGNAAPIVSIINIRNCFIKVTVSGILADSITAPAYYAYNSKFARFDGCSVTAAAAAQYGFYFEHSFGEMLNCIASNRLTAIRAYGTSKVVSMNNSGSGNSAGLYAEFGADIRKSGTQPGGATAEGAGAGGQIL